MKNLRLVDTYLECGLRFFIFSKKVDFFYIFYIFRPFFGTFRPFWKTSLPERKKKNKMKKLRLVDTYLECGLRFFIFSKKVDFFTFFTYFSHFLAHFGHFGRLTYRKGKKNYKMKKLCLVHTYLKCG